MSTYTDHLDSELMKVKLSVVKVNGILSKKVNRKQHTKKISEALLKCTTTEIGSDPRGRPSQVLSDDEDEESSFSPRSKFAVIEFTHDAVCKDMCSVRPTTSYLSTPPLIPKREISDKISSYTSEWPEVNKSSTRSPSKSTSSSHKTLNDNGNTKAKSTKCPHIDFPVYMKRVPDDSESSNDDEIQSSGQKGKLYKSNNKSSESNCTNRDFFPECIKFNIGLIQDTQMITIGRAKLMVHGETEETIVTVPLFEPVATNVLRRTYDRVKKSVDQQKKKINRNGSPVAAKGSPTRNFTVDNDKFMLPLYENGRNMRVIKKRPYDYFSKDPSYKWYVAENASVTLSLKVHGVQSIPQAFSSPHEVFIMSADPESSHNTDFNVRNSGRKEPLNRDAKDLNKNEILLSDEVDYPEESLLSAFMNGLCVCTPLCEPEPKEEIPTIKRVNSPYIFTIPDDEEQEDPNKTRDTEILTISSGSLSSNNGDHYAMATSGTNRGSPDDSDTPDVISITKKSMVNDDDDKINFRNSSPKEDQNKSHPLFNDDGAESLDSETYREVAEARNILRQHVSVTKKTRYSALDDIASPNYGGDIVNDTYADDTDDEDENETWEGTMEDTNTFYTDEYTDNSTAYDDGNSLGTATIEEILHAGSVLRKHAQDAGKKGDFML